MNDSQIYKIGNPVGDTGIDPIHKYRVGEEGGFYCHLLGYEDHCDFARVIDVAEVGGKTQRHGIMACANCIRDTLLPDWDSEIGDIDWEEFYPVIYAIVFTYDNCRRPLIYVGKTENLYKRIQQHIKGMFSGEHHNKQVQDSWNTLSTTLMWGSMQIWILRASDNSDNEELLIMEAKEIEKYSNDNNYYCLNMEDKHAI